MKHEFSWQIFEKCSYMKFDESIVSFSDIFYRIS